MGQMSVKLSALTGTMGSGAGTAGSACLNPEVFPHRGFLAFDIDLNHHEP
jgi:hypothetical protein